MNSNHPDQLINENLVAACGLFCGSCGIYLATVEKNAKKILEYAVVLKQSYDETLCYGCQSERKSAHCTRMCLFTDCVKARQISHCGLCADFPCQALIEFRSKMPHRTEIIESLDKLKLLGPEEWLIEMTGRFSCSNCATINSAYDLSCRSCQHQPGSGFVAENSELIENYLNR